MPKLSRRAWLAGALAVIGAGSRAAVAAQQSHTPASRESGQVRADGPARRWIIDALGEIHIEYDAPLLDQIRASGLRGCVVTVGNPALEGAAALEDLLAEIEGYDRHIASNGLRLARAASVRDLARAADKGAIGLLYAAQNAVALQDDPSRIEMLYARGLRIMQITYNDRNRLGAGCLASSDEGLTPFGADIVERMNRRGMLVDLSHCGDRTTSDAIARSRAPVAITHAGCRAVFAHPRNKSDEQIRSMADKGGVIGVYQINPYLGPKTHNTLDDYLRHIDHAVKVGGVDHVGVGSDREHRVIPDTLQERQKLADELSRVSPVTLDAVQWPFFLSELNHPRRMDTIRDVLSKRGHPAAHVDKILGGNFYRLFEETIG